MQAFTDASTLRSGSFHSYVLYHDNEVVLKRCYKSVIKSSMQAEIMSVILFLLDCKKRNIKDIVVNTDSLAVTTLSKSNRLYGKLITWMKALLEQTNGNIQWVRREHNTEADKLCRDARNYIESFTHVNLSKRGINDLIKESKETIEFQIGRECLFEESVEKINMYSLSEKDKNYFREYYCSLIYKNKRKTIDKVISWGKQRKFNNTKNGRKYFIENYIAHNHNASDIIIIKANHIFKVSPEIESLGLNKCVYDN